MEIDFHFGGTYVVARLAGFDQGQAEIIATCSQYVDDTVNSGPLNFTSGEAYYRISTAHEKHDYHLYFSVDERRTWIPFHFLPGNDPSGAHELEFYNRIVCRPHSEVAKEMVRVCIARQDAPHGLHRLGITAHVFIDTWAHQGFAGVSHRINMSSELRFVDPEEKPIHWLGVLLHGGWGLAFARMTVPVMRFFTDRIFPMGHGSVLHYPDHPFRKWSYKNGFGERVHRDNPKDFMRALDELCRVFRRYLLKDGHAQVDGLPEKDRQTIEGLVNSLRDDDPEIRLAAWLKAMADGAFSFGPARPVYSDHGPLSWKRQALRTDRARIWPFEKFDYTPAFQTCNWKLFHDAAQAHQRDVLREILPGFGICAI